MPIINNPPRQLGTIIPYIQDKQIATDRQTGAFNGITEESVSTINDDGSYSIRGQSANLTTTGVSSVIEVGDVVRVGWKGGVPVAILAHTARRAKFVPPGGAPGGVIEELFISLQNGKYVVFYRNADQVTQLNLDLNGEDDGVNGRPETVRWSQDGSAFYVRTINSSLPFNSQHYRFHIFKFNGKKADTILGKRTPSVSKVRIDLPLQKGIQLLDLTLTTTLSGTTEALEVVGSTADPTIIVGNTTRQFPLTGSLQQHRVYTLNDQLVFGSVSGANAYVTDAWLDANLDLFFGLTLRVLTPPFDAGQGDTHSGTAFLTTTGLLGPGSVLTDAMDSVVYTSTSQPINNQINLQEIHGYVINTTQSLIIYSTLGASLTKSLSYTFTAFGTSVYYTRVGKGYALVLGGPGTPGTSLASVTMGAQTTQNDQTLVINMFDPALAAFAIPTDAAFNTPLPSKAGYWTSAQDFSVLPNGEGVTVTGGSAFTNVLKHGSPRMLGVTEARPPLAKANTPDTKRRLLIVIANPPTILDGTHANNVLPILIDDGGAIRTMFLSGFDVARTGAGVSISGFILVDSTSQRHAVIHTILAETDRNPVDFNPFTNFINFLDLNAGTTSPVTNLIWDGVTDPRTLFQESQIPWFKPGGYDIKALRTDFLYACDEDILSFVKIPLGSLTNPPPAQKVSKTLPQQKKLKKLPSTVSAVAPLNFIYAVTPAGDAFLVDVPTRNYRVVLSTKIPLPSP